MQGIRRTTGIDRCIRAALFVDRQVAAHPEVAEVGAEIIAYNQGLRDQADRMAEAELSTLLALAHRRSKETSLKNSIRVVGYGVVGRHNGSRAASSFSVLFPEGHGGITKLSGPRLIEAASQLDQLLRDSSDEFVRQVVATHGAELTEAIGLAKAAEAAYVDAQANEAAARARLVQVKVEWIDAYYRAQRSFEAHFAGNRALAEIYFLRFRKTRKSSDTAEAEPVVDGPTETEGGDAAVVLANGQAQGAVDPGTNGSAGSGEVLSADRTEEWAAGAKA